MQLLYYNKMEQEMSIILAKIEVPTLEIFECPALTLV